MKVICKVKIVHLLDKYNKKLQNAQYIHQDYSFCS